MTPTEQAGNSLRLIDKFYNETPKAEIDVMFADCRRPEGQDISIDKCLAAGSFTNSGDARFGWNAPSPIGYLNNPSFLAMISVYHKINWFQKMCIKVCFGFTYTNDKTK